MASLIARVTTTSSRAPLEQLLTTPLGLDVWEVTPEHFVLQADEAQASRLEAMGYEVEQLQMIEPYLSSFATEAAATGYHTAASLEQNLRQLAERHPDVAELHEFGRSIEGRPLWALRIGERRGSDRKVAFFGCHHAREWISVEVPYRFAVHLLDNSSSEPIQGWLQHGEVWVAPMVNPDGHEHTRTTDRLWRKNRRTNQGGSSGVDANRTYGYMWGTLDSTPHPLSVGASRPSPVVDGVDLREMRGLAEDMERLIRGVHGQTYTAQQSSRLYPTAGDTTDWTYGEYDVPSLTIELRPASAMAGGVILPAEQIEPCWEENRPAALAFIRHILDPADG